MKSLNVRQVFLSGRSRKCRLAPDQSIDPPDHCLKVYSHKWRPHRTMSETFETEIDDIIIARESLNIYRGRQFL